MLNQLTMRELTRITLFTTLFLVVTSCSSLKKPPTYATVQSSSASMINQITRWQIEGKIGVKVLQEGTNAKFNWIQKQDDFNILLSGPLGQNRYQIKGNNTHLIITEGKHEQESKISPQKLTEHLGWPLPIEQLPWWIKGQPVPTTPYTESTYPDSTTREQLIQMSWLIEYYKYKPVAFRSEKVVLPHKIRFTRDHVTILLYIYRWQTLHE